MSGNTTNHVRNMGSKGPEVNSSPEYEAPFGPRPKRWPSGHRWLRGDEVESLPTTKWLIDGILPEGAFAVLYGAPGLGKSFAALDWSKCIGTGAAWSGHGVTEGYVAYVAAEDGKDLKYRRRAWHLHRFGNTDRPDKCMWDEQAWNIAEAFPKFIEDMKAEGAEGVQPSLVVFDTLARCFKGDENKTEDMAAFVAGVDAVRSTFPRCTVLVVHHTGKNESKGARGSSALLGAVDVEIALSQDGGALRLECTKMKTGEPFAPMWFKRKVVDVGQGKRSCVLVRAEKPSRTASAPDWLPEAREMKDAGASSRDIAAALKAKYPKAKVSKDTIERWLKRAAPGPVAPVDV